VPTNPNPVLTRIFARDTRRRLEALKEAVEKRDVLASVSAANPPE